MKVRAFAANHRYSAVFAVVFVGLWRLNVATQGIQTHSASAHQDTAVIQRDQASELVRIVREVTERYKDVAVAESEEFFLNFGCVSGPDSGAMGLHYVNFARVLDGVIDVTKPEIVIYEPTPSGRVRLIGADYLVLADAWDKANSGPPQLNGQLFHLFEAPNRFGLPAFYTLHVWAWKDNPNGAFVNWHPKVDCQTFNGQEQ